MEYLHAYTHAWTDEEYICGWDNDNPLRIQNVCTDLNSWDQAGRSQECDLYNALTSVDWGGDYSGLDGPSRVKARTLICSCYLYIYIYRCGRDLTCELLIGEDTYRTTWRDILTINRP